MSCPFADSGLHRPAAPTAEGGVVARGPVTVACKINGERAVVLGWGAAVLMQLAHPLVAAGVDDHSGFRASPLEQLRRFRRTLSAMRSITFGALPEAVETARRIDAIHGRIHGTLREAVGPLPAGTPYSARDPELLRWVHATLLDANLRTYQAFIGPLTPAEQDRYCADATWLGPFLGVAAETLPQSTAALHAYLDGMLTSGQIVVGPTARRLKRDLLTPSNVLTRLAGVPVRLPYRLVTAGLLPPAIRAAYGFRWTPAHAAALAGWMATSRRTIGLLPDRVRRWPEARALDHAAA